jgi:hypothetical protein
MLTEESLKEQVAYDPDTGVFRWKTRPSNRVKIGDIAGSINDGYVIIKLRDRKYRAHILAWLYVYGALPEMGIDHENLNRSDNRILNLREATGLENQGNTPISKANTSGYKGVCWDDRRKKWKAYIHRNRKIINLGLFDDILDAAEAYRTAAILQFGKFARFS